MVLDPPGKVSISNNIETFVCDNSDNGAGLFECVTNCLHCNVQLRGKRVGLMVTVLNSGASGQGSSPGRGHYVVFLGKTLYSQGASLHPGQRI